MKFSKPITREVEIDGDTFNVTFNDTGIEFRLKGKRKTARVEWTTVLGAARGEQGESAHEHLGIERGAGAQRAPEAAARPFGYQGGNETTQSAQPFYAQGTDASRENQTNAGETGRDTGEELSRSVSAGDVGPES